MLWEADAQYLEMVAGEKRRENNWIVSFLLLKVTTQFQGSLKGKPKNEKFTSDFSQNKQKPPKNPNPTKEHFVPKGNLGQAVKILP